MFYLLDKPKGISSFKAISNFAKANHISKIGHSGTLDPLATGALLVATEDDTKLLEYITNEHKTYVVTFKIGYLSDTYDVEGTLKKVSSKIESAIQVQKIVTTFRGKMQQIPPQFSAKKVNGKRSYILARQGILTNLKSITVNIFSINNFRQIDSNIFAFEVEVSKGTYIRSLIHDIGQKLSSGAIMTDLKRTKIGNLQLKTSVQKINPFQILEFEKILLLKKDVIALLNGKLCNVKEKDGTFLLVFQDQIIGIGKVENYLLKSRKILGKRIQKVL